jgi:2-iminobutanoate/2-iminopropanoate deaminase
MSQVISTSKAPKAIGPYSQAVIHNGIAYLSGQIAIDPVTNQVIDGDVVAQTHQALVNLKAVLEACASSLNAVLKTTVYLKDMADFPKVNEVYGQYFTGPPPARSTVQAAGLPRGVAVEIDAIAAVS